MIFANVLTSVGKKQIFSFRVLKNLGYVAIALLTALMLLACTFLSSPTTQPKTQPDAQPNAQAVISQEATSSEASAIATKSPSDELVVFWDKGYIPEEDEAIKAVVTGWEAQGGSPVKLSFYNSGETAPRTLRASQASRVPIDVLFAAKSVYPVSEWEGKLADVTEIVAPLSNSYTTAALQVAEVYGYNSARNRYYSVPLNQSTTHIHYWKDLLQEAGYQPQDIPTEWDEFWSFWKTVQARLSNRYPDIRSLGLPYSATALDTYHIFEQVLVAYDVELLDDRGNLRLGQPSVKAGIVKALNWYLDFYKQGYVPDTAVNWLDPDNNRNLLNRTIVMTSNPTLSIPAAVRNDEDLYFKKLGTVEFPHKPNGKPLSHLVNIRQVVVFADSPNQQIAKDFLTYLTRSDVLNTFLKASYGRFLPPSISQLKADSFWQDPADPHISTVVKTVVEGQTQPFYNALNPAYGTVMEENVWGQVIHAMATEGLSAEAGADRAIAQIQSIFSKTS